MADSEVDLINLALTDLGEKRITDREDGTPNAAAADAVFDHTRDEVLAMHRWNTATARARLAQLSAAPEWGFDHAYQLPPDFLRFDRAEDLDFDYRIEGRKLLTDEDSIEIAYIRRVKNVPEMGLPLQKAIVARLAWRLAKKLTGSSQIQAQKANAFQAEFEQAVFEDSDQSPIEQFAGSTLIDARTNHGKTDPFRPTRED